MVNEDLYMCKRENKLAEVDRNHLIERLELETPVIGEEGESTLAEWKDKNQYCYFFRKDKINAIYLSTLKNFGLTLVISKEQEESLGKRLDLSQFLIEIV